MYFVIGENFSWMAYNILLAFIPVLAAWLFYKAKKPVIKIILFISWLFFVPNTIYLFTDILHLMDQVSEFNLFGAVVLAVQYAFLFITGFLTYILSLYLIEKKMKLPSFIVIGLNFLVGFGVVLGRVYRLNSWDMIIEIENVIGGAIRIINSPEMILLVVLFGLFANFMYFLFRKSTIKYLVKMKKKI